MAGEPDIWTLAEQSLRFEWHGGGVTRVSGENLDPWNRLPCTLAVQLTDGKGLWLYLRGRERVFLPPGAAFCIAEGTWHRTENPSHESYVSRWAHCTFRILGSVDPLSLLHVPVPLSSPRSADLGDLCESLVMLRGESPDLLGAVDRQSLGFRMLGAVLQDAPLAPDALRRLRVLRRLEPLLRHIRQNLERPLTRDELARIAHLSPQRFHVLFKEALRLSPLAYVKQLRMTRAQHLLAATELSVGEICERAGYRDPFHFSRSFKHATGLSPSAFRQRVEHSVFPWPAEMDNQGTA